MKWFGAKPASAPEKTEKKVPEVSVESAVAAARQFREASQWVEALVELERVAKSERASAEYHGLHAWALAEAGRLDEARAALKQALATSPQDSALLAAGEDIKKRSRLAAMGMGADERRGVHKLRFGGGALGVRPHDLAVLTEMLQDLRPSAIFELGTRGGGLARWLAAFTQGMGLGTHVESADWGCRQTSTNERLQFRGGDLRKPGSVWQSSQLKRLPHPRLIILRAGGGYEVAWSSLRAWHKHLAAGDWLCLFADCDGNGDVAGRHAPEDALARFLSRNPVEYESLPQYAFWFGEGRPPTSVRCVRRTALNAFDESASPGLEAIRRKMEAGEWRSALDELNAIKATRTPRRGADYLRSLCFLELNDPFSACEAAKEEMRYFPGHKHAEAVAAAMLAQTFPGTPKMGGAEFHEIYRVVRPYTMLSNERLYSLYLRTRLVCQMDIPGDMVECGVAAGGGSAMIAATMARHTKRPRKLYSCDTFEGMPMPTAKDVAWGVDAEASGWGSGTCAAPPGSLQEVCAKLGVEKLVEPVKGFFKDALPGLKDRLPDGIAFLHMDGDWYESTWDILANLYEKTQPRGFIQVDDYGHWEGCRQAMWEYAKQHEFELKVHVIDGTGVWLQRPDRKASDLMLLNLGCGEHYHAEWVNLDIAPAGPGVIQHDLADEPLPFEDASCAAVYHSHVLEHIPPDKAPAFIAECSRVLAPGGVLRVAVPDLEGIARAYLRQLEVGDHAKHEWMILELVDQLTRHHSGGRMMEYWKQNPMPAEEFVFERIGREARQFVEKWRAHPGEPHTPSTDAGDIGRFRVSGEIHQWMYDRMALERLLRQAGFEEVCVCSATDSKISHFATYQLDADLSGQVRKPDSLFMEACKPSLHS